MSQSAITKIKPNLAVPDYLKDIKTKGTEELANIVLVPRISILQDLSDRESLNKFGAGSAIIKTSDALVLNVMRDSRGAPNPPESQATILFTPIFFYREWLQMNPLMLKGAEPVIAERSYDPDSELARKCRNKETWEEPHPNYPNAPKMNRRNFETLNFVIFIQEKDHPLYQQPMVMSFARGEYSSGQKFATLIRSRNAPIFACVFEAMIVEHSAPPNFKWWGWQIDNPRENFSPWVSAEDIQRFKEHHENCVALHRDRKLRADATGMDDEVSAETRAADSQAAAASGTPTDKM